MTKNTLKQLIRECIKESLNENAFDKIAAKDFDDSINTMKKEPSDMDEAVNWLLSDYKTNPLHDKAHPFFDLRDPLKFPYIILATASEDGAAIPLMCASKEDAEAYKNQKGKEGVKFTGPFKLTKEPSDMNEAFSSKTVTTPKEAAIILKVADMLSKIGSYTNPSKGKGPNGNVTEIFAGFMKDGKQVARVMISKNDKHENDVEIKVEVTSQKWSSTDRNYYDNPVITKSFNIDDPNLIKFLKNPIQGKFDAKASNVTKADDSDSADLANRVIDQANDILYKTDRADVANDYDTAALYNTVRRMIQKRKKNGGEKQITGKELADLMTRGFND